MTPDPLSSPRLRRFIAEAATDVASATAALERDLERAKGPLVEPHPADPAMSLVSFVVRSPEPVSIRSQLAAGLRGSRFGIGMTPVEGSDIWYHTVEAANDTCVPYTFLRGTFAAGEDVMSLTGDPEAFAATMASIKAATFNDAYNPDRMFPVAAIYDDPADEVPSDTWESVLTLPGATAFPWYDEPEATGTVTTHVIFSKVFDNQRTVAVWTPPGYDPSTTYPTLILLDGEGYQRVANIGRILDNLVSGGHIPPLIALLVHNATATSRLTELPCNPQLSQFLADELLPELRATYPLTTDPTEITVGGASYGGLASNWLAFDRPDVFGNVISMSASLWHGPCLGTDDAQPQWLTQQYESAERRPGRFWLEVGALEDEPIPYAGGVSMVEANRRFVDVLHRKGYHVQGFRIDSGGHDMANWRRDIPDALIALFGAPHEPSRESCGEGLDTLADPDPSAHEEPDA